MDADSVGISRRAWLRLTTGASLAACLGGPAPAWGQTMAGTGRTNAPQVMFQNPLFAGDYADPTILRVGADYYITHTCYRYAPQLTVWHSRDLVNWTPISHALNHTYGDVWAPDLAEHNGRYFIYFPLNGHLVVVHAASPAGPWSEPIDLKVGNIDPGHVVGPDGTRYLYSSGGNVVQLSPDGLSTVGESKPAYHGWQYPKDWQVEGFWLESPKLARRGRYYYLICAEGGTSGPPTSHMAVVARAESPLGPWENSPHNPLIHTYNADEDWWSVGHGSLVSTPDDRWFFVYHGYRKGSPTLGRNTLLEPVAWTGDGWPQAPLGALRGAPFSSPLGAEVRPMISLSDDFTDSNLRATWGAWNETDMSRFKAGNDALAIRAKGNSAGESSPLTVMARDESYEVQVAATVQGGGSAALGLFYDPRNGIWVVLGNGQLAVQGPKQAPPPREWKAGSAHLRIMNRGNRVEIFASTDGAGWESLAAPIDVSGYTTNILHGFQALRPALAATGNGGGATFAGFRYRKL